MSMKGSDGMNPVMVTRLVEILKRDALKLGTFRLASGRSSHYYVDGRRVTLSAAGVELVASGMLQVLARWPGVDAVGGLTMGADPIVGAMLGLADRYGMENLKGFLVRKEAKGHGTGKLVEGPIEAGMKVAVVDDVVTTGGSSIQAIEAVKGAGCEVVCVLAMLDRLEGASAAFEKLGIPFRSLCTIRDLGVEPLGTE
jgi:orotate phosphoribosyltransferase